MGFAPLSQTAIDTGQSMGLKTLFLTVAGLIAMAAIAVLNRVAFDDKLSMRSALLKSGFLRRPRPVALPPPQKNGRLARLVAELASGAGVFLSPLSRVLWPSHALTRVQER